MCAHSFYASPAVKVLCQIKFAEAGFEGHKLKPWDDAGCTVGTKGGRIGKRHRQRQEGCGLPPDCSIVSDHNHILPEKPCLEDFSMFRKPVPNFRLRRCTHLPAIIFLFTSAYDVLFQ
jgi:hypothetical protein